MSRKIWIISGLILLSLLVVGAVGWWAVWPMRAQMPLMMTRPMMSPELMNNPQAHAAMHSTMHSTMPNAMLSRGGMWGWFPMGLFSVMSWVLQVAVTVALVVWWLKPRASQPGPQV